MLCKGGSLTKLPEKLSDKYKSVLNDYRKNYVINKFQTKITNYPTFAAVFIVFDLYFLFHGKNFLKKIALF